MTRPDPSSLEEAKARYEAERTKRLRDEGLAQYQSLSEHHLDRDPWADPDFTRDAITEEVDVVILGGGFAGMLAGINLLRRGVTRFRIVEKAADFGGTWYWNRYPGCMCDVDATIYLPLLEETGYMPTEKYASASEIFGYCQLLGRHFGLYEHALFQTEVESLTWDDDAHRWDLVSRRGDRIRTQFFVSAGGLMHKAKLPGIDGIDRFGGKAFHTTRWDYDFTGGSPTEPMDRLADKVVGIIGTGATAVQVVPQLARSAKAVYVFQRTPSAVGIRGQQPIDEAWFRSLPAGWQVERTHNFTEVVTGNKPDRDLVADGWGQALREDTQREPASEEERADLEAIDFEVMEGFRRRIDELVEDPETSEKLKPWYGKHCKRICFHDEYLQSFNEPNVHLVDTDGRGVRRRCRHTRGVGAAVEAGGAAVARSIEYADPGCRGGLQDRIDALDVRQRRLIFAIAPAVADDCDPAADHRVEHALEAGVGTGERRVIDRDMCAGRSSEDVIDVEQHFNLVSAERGAAIEVDLAQVGDRP